MEHLLSEEERFGTGKKKLSVYVTGMVLCVLLTLVSFGLVSMHWLSAEMMIPALVIAAIAQFIVQVVCFLRLNADNPQSKMNLMSFIFTIVILLVLVGGSLWIMINLHDNMMMPGTMPMMHDQMHMS